MHYLSFIAPHSVADVPFTATPFTAVADPLPAVAAHC